MEVIHTKMPIFFQNFHTGKKISYPSFYIVSIFCKNLKFYKRWLRSLIRTGLRQEIHEDDIYRAAKTHKSIEITKSFSKHWEKEKQKSTPSLLNVLFKVYGPSVLIFGFIGTSVKSISRYILCVNLFIFRLSK